MKKKVLIVEDQFVEANDLQLMLRKSGYEVCGIARSVDIAEELVKKEKPALVLLDIYLKGKRTGIDLAQQLKEQNIAFIFLSANSNEEVLSQAKKTEPYGFIVKPFREKDLLVTLEIAHYRHEHSTDSRARRESGVIEGLKQVINQNFNPGERLLQAAKRLQPEIPFDCLSVVFQDAPGIPDNIISFMRIGFDEYQVLGATELARTVHLSAEQVAKIISRTNNHNAGRFSNDDVFRYIDTGGDLEGEISEAFGMKSVLLFPATLKDEGNCVFYFFSRRSDVYGTDHINLLHRLKEALLTEKSEKSGANVLSSINTDKNQTTTTFGNGNAQLPCNRFEGIIGNNHLLLSVFDQITQVAPFDTSVLILGESGTGKERIVDCIHNLSSRKRKPLVKVNCATLPPTLIESELFGHEKGSFTGATEKRTGKFEQANGGTIFLDEIGEMPVDLQVKLLRVLQEKEIEPVGGRSSLKIDVRIVAATNRNLEKEVAEGRFRLDLYYRLNVFPIELPPLRERMEDIPALAQHFIDIYNRKSGKNVTGLSVKVIKNMMSYSWPGNIRELEHVIERGVLLAKGTTIEDISLSNQAKIIPMNTQDVQMKTILENERDHIINALKKCNGKIFGTGGAAEILKVPPSTLQSKMKKLDIRKDNYE